MSMGVLARVYSIDGVLLGEERMPKFGQLHEVFKPTDLHRPAGR